MRRESSPKLHLRVDAHLMPHLLGLDATVRFRGVAAHRGHPPADASGLAPMWGLRFDATDLLMARTDFRVDDPSATVGPALELLLERVRLCRRYARQHARSVRGDTPLSVLRNTLTARLGGWGIGV